jgi:hypothetical protein
MPQLQVLSGKRQGFVLDIDGDELVDVGNRKTAKLSIRDPWISWNHAKITLESGKYFVEDTGSSNGTWVNGEKVKRRELKANDVIYFGKTKVKFAVAASKDEVISSPVADWSAAPPAKGDAPWWDKVIEGGGAAGAPGGGEATRALEAALRDERKMREALEKFLDVPRGTPLGDAAKAGQLEQRVRELERELERARSAAAPAPAGPDPAMIEKLRQEAQTKTVEAESRASAAEAKAIDLESRLKDKTEQAKKELARAREKLQAELDDVKKALEDARAAAATQGDAAVKTARERGDRLETELQQWKAKARDAEKRAEDAQTELRAAQANAASSSELDRLEKMLAEAKADAARWEEEHKKVVQEIDEISMEQIEIEDGLKERIRELEARLGIGEPAESAEG